jgi:hypothetical protein
MVEAIVMGMFMGGLIEPHDPNLSEQFVGAVHQYIAETNATPFAHVGDSPGHLEQLINQGVEEVEIFGIWQHRCVSYVVKKALEVGLKVRVPKDYTHAEDVNASSLENGVRSWSKIDFEYKEDLNFHYFTPSAEIKTRLIDVAESDLDIIELIRRYGALVDSEKIKPELITFSSGYDRSFPLGEKQRAVFATHGKNILGISTYEVIPEDERDVDDILNARFSKYDLAVNGEKVSDVDFSQHPGFRDYLGNGEIVELGLIESFVPGTGRLLVDSIRNSRPVEIMMAWSYTNAKGFYEKLGFVDSGISLYEHNNPLMVRHNG